MTYWTDDSKDTTVGNIPLSKYHSPLKCNSSTTTIFTGSNHGYGAIWVQNATNVTVTAANGTEIAAAAFVAGSIYEIAPSKVAIGSTGVVYALKKSILG